MDKQNIHLHKYITDHDKTMNREKMFPQRKERGVGWKARAGVFIHHQNTRQKAWHTKNQS
jgi:hypothetical protein